MLLSNRCKSVYFAVLNGNEMIKVCKCVTKIEMSKVPAYCHVNYKRPATTVKFTEKIELTKAESTVVL